VISSLSLLTAAAADVRHPAGESSLVAARALLDTRLAAAGGVRSSLGDGTVFAVVGGGHSIFTGFAAVPVCFVLATAGRAGAGLVAAAFGLIAGSAFVAVSTSFLATGFVSYRPTGTALARALHDPHGAANFPHAAADRPALASRLAVGPHRRRLSDQKDPRDQKRRQAGPSTAISTRRSHANLLGASVAYLSDRNAHCHVSANLND
jgi:hypothetical protein